MHAPASFEQYQQLLRQPVLREEYNATAEPPYLLVTVDGTHRDTAEVTMLPTCPVVAIGEPAEALLPLFDVVVPDLDALAPLLPRLKAQPLACSALVQLLRHNARSNVIDGLMAESLAYSTLQHSRGFQHWLRTSKRPASRRETDPVLLLDRQGSHLDLALNRPAAHNAYNMALKDALCAALQLALTDTSISTVGLRGIGPSFCAGGDLSEFGDATDAALAHASRTTRSAGALLAELACATEAYLHGACIGAGIEIPAFADRVCAHPDTFFQLPEINMGLVPGAGGTVSITKRIGRHRTAWLAISNERLEVERALAWNLIDEINA